MTRHDDRVYLQHMLRTALRARELVDGIAREAFEADDRSIDAALHRLQTIGEAATQVSQTGRDALPGIPWAQIVGMRHRIVHDYLNIDLDVVWAALTESVPELIAELDRVVER